MTSLAAQKLALEKPGQTLQATALVHEAYLRLVGAEQGLHWRGRRHFLATAAEAMRRILVDQARRKQSLKHGGQYSRLEVSPEHQSGQFGGIKRPELAESCTFWDKDSIFSIDFS